MSGESHALSIRALTAYATPARRDEDAARTRRAAAWLAGRQPLSTEDRVMQLLGLHWADAEPRLRETRVRELLGLQRADGGWPKHRISPATRMPLARYCSPCGSSV